MPEFLTNNLLMFRLAYLALTTMAATSVGPSVRCSWRGAPGTLSEALASRFRGHHAATPPFDSFLCGVVVVPLWLRSGFFVAPSWLLFGFSVVSLRCR